MSEDTKLIRLATLTTFVHSVGFLLYILYLIISITQRGWSVWWSTIFWNVLSDYIQILAPTSDSIAIFVILGIIILIGYSLLPPIGEAAMITYINSDHKSWTLSFGSWVNKFFPMFEFNATMALFSIVWWGASFSRLWMMDILNFLTITLMWLWLLAIILALILLPYTKFLITLDGYKYFDAMKQSVALAARHFWVTIKFVVINMFLYVRFLINIIIVVGIPMWLIYLASRYNIADADRFGTLVVFVVVTFILLTAYINGIIEAFFLTYRAKVYASIRHGSE